MAKRADSVVGIDLGKHVLKGVALRRRSDSRFILTNFASRPVPEEFDSAEDLSRELKQLLCDLGGSAKACAFAVSDPSTILRIIEQPDTPVDLLRNALRFNGLAVLNQECKDFVLDVAPVASQVDGGSIMENPSAAGSKRAVQSGVVTQTKYLVGGMLRSQVKQIVAGRWDAWELNYAIRLDFSKVSAKKASTEFLFPGVWLARKRFCRR